jgi:hypothetical protein
MTYILSMHSKKSALFTCFSRGMGLSFVESVLNSIYCNSRVFRVELKVQLSL